MQPLRLNNISSEDLAELERLYDSTRDVRVRTRAQMILLAAEQRLTAPQIATIVRRDRQTVRRWLKRYQSDGVAGLQDAPRSGAPGKVTASYQQQLVQLMQNRPSNLGLPFGSWTLKRVARYMEKKTGIRVSYETVRLYLKDAGIILNGSVYGQKQAGNNGKRTIKPMA